MLSEAKLQALAALVTTVESKFPVVIYKNGGSRAQEAAKIIEGCEIVKVGESFGVDYWKCHDYTMSVAGGGCTCADTLCVDGKRFCKHRLAAMFVVKLGGLPELKLTSLFKNANSDDMTLRVQVLHTINGNKFKLAGHRYGGETWNQYEHADCYEFTENEFYKAMADAGWGMAQRPVKQPSLYYHYFLHRGTGVFGLNDTPSNVVEKRLQERRFEELVAIQDLIN